MTALCVQNEPVESPPHVESSKPDAEPSASASPMSPRRLLVCLAVIGWSGHELVVKT